MTEISPETWTRWLNSPETKKFFKFIDDFREQTSREIALDIAEGIAVPHEIVTEAAIRCQVYLDITNMTCEQINEFYSPEKEEEENVDS